MNIVVRFKNPAFLVTFSAVVVAFVYQVLGMFDIVPSISENDMVNTISLVINLLSMLGVFVDPTTKGVWDSDRAMNYETPE